MTHHHNTVSSVQTTSTANTSNPKHFDQDHHSIGRSRASSTAALRSERSRSASNASISSTTVYCDSASIQQQHSYPNQTSNDHNESSVTTTNANTSLIRSSETLHHPVTPSRVSQPTLSSNVSSTTSPNVQQLNLMHPTPQQRLTIERLLQIPPESVQSRNPKLHELLVQLRRQYMWQAVTTPITSVDRVPNNVHPLEKMKQEDAMVFSSHIDEICASVNQLLEEADVEEYGLNQTQKFYKVVWLQEQELKEKAKEDIPSLEEEHMHDEEDEDECEEDEFEEEVEENAEQCPQPSSSTAPTLSTDEESCQQMEDEPTESNSTEDAIQASVNAQSQDPSNTKLQEFFRQLENVEPIPNGKLSFFQNHHLVVGKFDKKLLVEDNVLSCTVMKKSTLNVVVHRRCTRLKKENDRFPFDATAGTYHDRRILKKQALAKSVVRFAKVKVDFGKIVDEVINKSPVFDQEKK